MSIKQLFGILRRLIGKLFNNTGNKEQAMDIQQIKKELQELTRGLLYYSESEYPFAILDWDKDQSGILAVHPPGVPFEEIRSADFFEKVIRNMNQGDDEMKKVGARYRKLYDFIQSNFESCSIWRSGKIEISIYIVCCSRDGDCLALKTTSIET